MTSPSRRTFFAKSLAAGAAVTLGGPLLAARGLAAAPREANIGLGLVTYLWGKDWDLATLIENCQQAGIGGVELRTTHAHGVEPKLSGPQREAVQQRFSDSSVTLVGLGSNERFDHPDPKKLEQAIDATKQFIRLSHDVGGTGVKVKPDSFHKDVPREQTIEQIGRALNKLGEFGAGFGQQVRLEVHGQCSQLPTIKAIMDVAEHENVGVCWNCNAADLEGDGLKHNFRLVKDRLAATCHIRALDDAEYHYPYEQLIDLLVAADYAGWVLLEARGQPADPIAALKNQRKLFAAMVAKAIKNV